jgi:hypothetical protein
VDCGCLDLEHPRTPARSPRNHAPFPTGDVRSTNQRRAHLHGAREATPPSSQGPSAPPISDAGGGPRSRTLRPVARVARAHGDATRGRRATSGRFGISLPSPPLPSPGRLLPAAGPELCDPGSSGAIAVWDKQ